MDKTSVARMELLEHIETTQDKLDYHMSQYMFQNLPVLHQNARDIAREVDGCVEVRTGYFKDGTSATVYESRTNDFKSNPVTRSFFTKWGNGDICGVAANLVFHPAAHETIGYLRQQGIVREFKEHFTSEYKPEEGISIDIGPQIWSSREVKWKSLK